jgi:hypothetical protein
MAIVVSLKDLIGDMQLLSNDVSGYLNRVTGEITLVTSDDMAAVENDEDLSGRPESEKELLEKIKEILSSDDSLELPGQYDIHEYEIMERFCISVSDPKISDILLDQIQSSGAFRRFNNMIRRYDIEKDWYKFRDVAYKEIAIDWLESNGLAFTDDL